MGNWADFLPVLTLLFFGGMLLGYLWGRRDGKQEGFKIGFTYAPLEMRRQVLIEGVCLICGRPLTDKTNTNGYEEAVN